MKVSLPSLIAVVISWAVLGVLASCSSQSEPDDPRFAALAKTDIEPGKGWGKFALEESTLGQVFSQFGPGKVSMLFGDTATLECRYYGRQIVLSFDLPQSLYNDETLGLSKDLLRDTENFVRSHPDYAGLKLSGLTLQLPKLGQGQFPGSLGGQGGLDKPVIEFLNALGVSDFVVSPSGSWCDQKRGISVAYEVEVIEDEEKKTKIYEARELKRITIFPPHFA